MCEEVGDDRQGAMISLTFEGFPAVPTRAQNESNSDKTQHIEPKSENCMAPLECAEDMVPQIRQDPI